MNRDSHRQLAARLLPAVLAAGRLEMSYFQTGLAVETKADSSPVTVADRAAEDIIVASLAEVLPGVAIVAEEAFAAGHRPALTDPFLLVDALDGTKQFVSGHREFTINIALVEGGQPVFGLIYAPALGDLLLTEGPARALRAHIDPASNVTTLDAANPAAIHARPPPASGLTALQSRSRNLEVSNTFLEDFAINDRRRLGSSYKFCLIACGEADIYPQLGDTREWDIAAGQAILLAAGGTIAALDGSPMRYGKSGVDYLNPPFIASSRPLAALRRVPA